MSVDFGIKISPALPLPYGVLILLFCISYFSDLQSIG
jgi:hypothetical protein